MTDRCLFEIARQIPEGVVDYFYTFRQCTIFSCHCSLGRSWAVLGTFVRRHVYFDFKICQLLIVSVNRQNDTQACLGMPARLASWKHSFYPRYFDNLVSILLCFCCCKFQPQMFLIPFLITTMEIYGQNCLAFSGLLKSKKL